VVAPDQLQTTLTPNDPTLSGQLRTPLSVLEELDFSLQKVIARRATMELCRGETVNLGFGISALVPRILVEEGLASEVTWIIEQGAVGGVPLTDFAFGCAMNPQALMQSADQFTLLQGGGFDHAMLSFLEIDEQGNVNVHYLPSRRHVTAGIGGFADITSGAKSIVFSGTFTAGRRNIAIEDDRIAILTDGAQPKLVQRVAEVSFSGRRALAEGQRVLYVTERCVMELRPEGVTVVEISPGIDLQRDVLDRAEFRLLVADDLRETDSRVLRRELLGLSLDAEPATAVVTAPEMTDRVAL
jgi:propionate CoA-transferase